MFTEVLEGGQGIRAKGREKKKIGESRKEGTRDGRRREWKSVKKERNRKVEEGWRERMGRRDEREG